MRQPPKKLGLSALLAMFVATTMFGSLFTLTPARAQWTIVGDLPRMATEIGEKIKEGLGVAVLNGALRAVSYAARKIAYDAAVWVASGGKGQQPLAFSKGFGAYMKDVGSASFGEAVSSIEDQFGVSICQIPDVKLDLALRIGIRGLNTVEPKRQGDCDFQTFTKNWSSENLKSKYGSVEGLTKQFNASLKTENTDFGVYLDSVAKIDEYTKKSREALLLDRQEGQGTKNLTDYVSGNILTPAQQVKKFIDDNSVGEQQKADQATIYSAIGSGFVQVIPSTISMFLNTLAGTMLKNFMTNGTLPFGLGCVGENNKDCLGGNPAEFAGSGARGGRQAAQAVFSELLVPTINPNISFDIVAELSSCPDTPSAFNCRMDGDLVAALQSAFIVGGEPMTIREALDKGYLHKDWRLLPPSRPENQIDRAYETAYTYANIKALRLARILPLGFEIAALESDPDNPWKLGEVVGMEEGDGTGWEDCTDVDNNGTPEYDAAKKFCHLIDPNWILKAPKSRCNAFVFGNQPLSGGVPNRLQECVDLSSVVAYNSDKTPLSYAYCAREKNVWKSNADTCDSQYATCLAYTAPDGQQVGYLQRTLNTGNCDASNVGCSAYSLTQNSSGIWQQPAFDATLANFNRGIHFNNKLSSACSANSAGCSAFTLAGNFPPSARGGGEGVVGALYLRKAPDYLGCYDAEPAVAGVKWPTTTAELSIIAVNKKPQCADYSQACIPSEVGCNMFTAVKSGWQIPGKFTPATIKSDGTGIEKWNDQCDAKCDGYDGYVRLADNYSSSSPVDYIIPSTNATCAREEVGCTGFTNMSAVYEGGEQVEYFSLLRSCIKPDATKQKNFYTYEGSTLGGYQLKVYTLEKDEEGGPKYFYKDDAERLTFNQLCSEEKYKDNTAATDCRQFNDDQGAVYYRLLGKTIVVSDKCTPYRLNSTEMEISTPGSEKCFQNGEYKDGFCYYNGLPGGVIASEGQSNSCSATAESCHAYKGNAGNNIENVASLDFENSDTPLSGWNSGAVLSVESTKVGGHSVGYVGNGALEWSAQADDSDTVGLVTSTSYSLSFWAKGRVGGDGNLNVILAGVSLGTIQLSDVWRLYEFGAKQIVSGANAKLIINNSASVAKTIYLDNLHLTKVVDSLYLVQKKLTVDPLCDSNLTDNLPGEALGCKGYTVPDVSATFYLTNFSYLCRENAIGCTALIDTQNTLDTDKPKAYNVQLFGGSGDLVRVVIEEKEFSCQILVGEDKCHVDIDGFEKLLTGGISGAFVDSIEEAKIEYKNNVGTWIEYYPQKEPEFTTSTAFIPADTATSTPIYLVANKEATCNQVDLGCTYAGLQKQTPTGIQFTTVTIKNDPAQYDAQGGGTLCQAEAVGCNAYTSGAGSTYYFKDPIATGQKVCAYKARATALGSDASGWFWKDVGRCGGADTGAYCSSNSDCAVGVGCDKTQDWACYPDYRLSGNDFGLWSYGDRTKYQNFVGECPTAQIGCTEFIDRNASDPATDLAYTSYFWIKNSKIDYDTCAGKVSLREGCVLFDETDVPRKQWNMVASYEASENNDSRLTAPVDVSGRNDANQIIKVTRDRECGEWLQCKRSHSVLDTSQSPVGNNIFKEVCEAVGRCDEGPADSGGDSITNCGRFVSAPSKVLTVEDYRRRDINWGGMDYSGYSLLNMYQPDALEQFNISATTRPDWRLVKRVQCTAGFGTEQVCLPPAQNNSYGCKVKYGASAISTDDVRCANNAVCRNQVCVQTHRGDDDFDGPTVPAESNYTENKLEPACRAYPEVDAPFPTTPQISGSDLTNASSFYQAANKCNEAISGTRSFTLDWACECDYTKVTYGETQGLKRYFNYLEPNSRATEPGVPVGICQNGNVGISCSTDAECQVGGAVGGFCALKQKESKLLGWRGYCLEPDYSRLAFADPNKYACLSWLPVGSLSGFADIDNQHLEAGYLPSEQLRSLGYTPQGDDLFGQFYCQQSTRFDNLLVNRDGSNAIKVDTANVDDCYSDDVSVATPHSLLNNFSVSTNIMPDLSARCFNIANTQETNLKQSDIEYIKFTVAENTDESPKQNTNLFIYPNVYKNDNKPYIVGHLPLKGDSSKSGIYVAGNFMGKKNLPAFFYSSQKDDKDGDGTYGYINDEGVLSVKYKEDETWKQSFRGDLFGAGQQAIAWRMTDTLGYAELAGLENISPDSLSFFSSGPYVDTSIGENYRDYINYEPSDCADNETDGEDDWHGVMAYFDPDAKQLVGYWMYYCDHSGGNGHISYNITIKLRNSCQGVAETTFDATGRSAGWTDRLWKRSDLTTQEGLSGTVGFNTLSAPFGSMRIKSGIDPYDSASVFGNLSKLPVYLSPSSGDSFHCNPLVTSDPPVGYNDCVFNYSSASVPPATVGLAYDNILGSPLSGDLNLRQVFAKPSSYYTYNSGSSSNYYKGYSSSAPLYNETGTVGSVDRAPKIYPVINCELINGVEKCLEGDIAGVTVNNKWRSGENAVINANPAEASLRFYAFADSNQMPLRSVSINWDDGSPVEARGSGFYRNRREAADGGCTYVNNISGVASNYYCRRPGIFKNLDNTINIDAQSLVSGSEGCDSDTDCRYLSQCVAEGATPQDPFGPLEFGRILNRTCDNKYFEFTNVYDCTRASVNYRPATGRGTTAGADICDDSSMTNGCCEYTPKVQVKDNWGWCNGGFYDGNDTSDASDDNCAISSGAWTPFRGKILVPPSQ